MKPSLTVIVPMYNAPENLERCLAALRASSTDDFELIISDDCSPDERAIALAKESGARYHRMSENGGPGIARNAAAQLATGDVLVFVDSDVLVHVDTLEKIRTVMADESVASLFGSYDDRPAARGIVTEYRNLLHHWTHTTGPPEATTFWAGCGAIRRDVFQRHGGFDDGFRRPSIEDIELRMRMHAAGDRILLRPEIQCTHLKRWSFVEMVRVDVTCRAIPWTHLLIDRPGTGGDLNVESSQKLCVVFVYLAWLTPLPAALLLPPELKWIAAALPLACLAGVAWINRALYGFFFKGRGLGFGIIAVLLHLFYFVYSGAAFAWAQVTHRLGLYTRIGGESAAASE